MFKYDVALVTLRKAFDPDIAMPICILPKNTKIKPKNNQYMVSGMYQHGSL